MMRSINIKTKEKCCGCGACYQRCPKHCIQLSEDCEGFIYPNVNHDSCIDCGLCVDVCPVVNSAESRKPDSVYAAMNADISTRLSSSSGGIFSAIAEDVIMHGGVVFGARFDTDWSVIHDWTDSVEGLCSFRGSKYVQSSIGNSYQKAEQFLKSGRQVLFSGTPCQIAGLKRFLRKDYPNLIAVDIICHGVPSPLVWRKYVSTLLQFKDADAERATDSCAPKNVTHRTDIQFRDKRLGWANFGFSVRYAPSNDCAQSKKLIHDIFEPFEKNIYMKGFLRNLYLRPSCASCPSKSGKSGADITLADFWGVSRHYPELYDKDGVSLVIVASERGQFVIDALNIRKSPVEYKKAIEGNSPYEHSVIFSPTRHIFWKFFPKYGIFAVEKALKAARPSVATRVISRLKRLIIS